VAGLLDWLTDGIGSQMGTGATGSSGPLLDATNNYASPGSAPLSPDELPGATPPAAPPTPSAPPAASPPVNPATTDLSGGMQGGGPAPAPAVPLPMARPAGAPGSAPGATMPPAAAPTTGAPMPITPPAPNPDSGPAAPPVESYKLGDQTALGRSLGIDPNSNGFRSAMAGLGEGLTAAGNSKGKSAGQAFAAGAGGSLTGATKQDSAQYDQRLKALQLAVNAQSAGDKAAYNKNYAEYLKGKLANDEKNATPGGKKSSAWNKPDSQKFIDAQNALSKDPDIRASQKILEAAVAGGNGPLNQPRIDAAQAAHTALVQQKQQMYLAGVGLSQAKIQFNAQNPPGTTQNPHIIVGDEKAAREQFDTYVKPGQAYRNPRDGKIYIRKVGDHMDDDAADQQTPAAPAPSAPAAPGPAPTALDPEEGERD
jgi:hypothetical protein